MGTCCCMLCVTWSYCLGAAGLPQHWSRSVTSLAGHTIPEAEQLADGPAEHHALASLLNSFQSLGPVSSPHHKPTHADSQHQTGVSHSHMASPFASPEHAPVLEAFEGGDAKTVGSRRTRRQSSAQPGQASGGLSLASSSSSGASCLPNNFPTGVNSHTPFASPKEQLYKMSSASSMGSGPGKSPSGGTSQNVSRQSSSPTILSPKPAP